MKQFPSRRSSSQFPFWLILFNFFVDYNVVFIIPMNLTNLKLSFDRVRTVYIIVSIRLKFEINFLNKKVYAKKISINEYFYFIFNGGCGYGCVSEGEYFNGRGSANVDIFQSGGFPIPKANSVAS